jgi:uncharacterized protein
LNVIIGRNKEKNELDEAYHSGDAELIAIYGRRRAGKTYLVKNYIQSKKCIFFQTVGIYKGPLKEQLERFAKELGDAYYHGASIKASTTWMEAFDALTQAIARAPKSKKNVLFFDELPWMATRKSNIVPAIEYFWNRHWSNNKQIKLILCGSAASWIIKNIIKNRGGLHNRITRKIRLTPFNLHETLLYLKYIKYPCSHQQAAKIFMVTGGVPFYLKNLKKNLSIDQNINSLFFKPEGQFFNEFDEIFSSLFQKSEHYKEIVTLIAAVKEGINRSTLEEKNKLTGIGGRLTHRLEDLENAGFISIYMPYGHKKRGVFYRISDEYCYFYLKWIKPIKMQLTQNPDSDFWKGIVNTPSYFNWMGYTFENICYKHIAQIRKTLQISDSSLASPWRSIPTKGKDESGAQIDLLFDRDDDSITICEIKYTDKPFAIDKQYAHKLTNKIEVFTKATKIKKKIFTAIISANGLKETMYSAELINGGVVTLEDLFKE